MLNKLIHLLAKLLFLFFICCCSLQSTKAQQPCGTNLSPVFGVTVESVDNVDAIISALREIRGKCIPTLRIVFQPPGRGETEDSLLTEYEAALERIRGKDPLPKYAYIMGLLVDSQSFYLYEEAKMSERAEKYADRLNEYVDVWEAGNEINGDWTGWKSGSYSRKSGDELSRMRISVGTRVKIVYDKITEVYKSKRKTPSFALNLYFNDDNIDSIKKSDFYIGNHCRNEELKKCDKECLHDYEMFTWSKKYLKPQQNKLKFDYVLFSFYKDDCCSVPNYPVFWAKVFAKLSREFTVDGKVPKVGFGEVAPQCYCSKDNQGKPNEDDEVRRVDACCRPEQPAYIREYYQTLNRDVKIAISKLPGNKPDYIGGFFYWYFYQDALAGDEASKQVLNALIESAETWR